MARCPKCGSFTTVSADAEDTGDDESSILQTVRARAPQRETIQQEKVVPRFREAMRFVWETIKANYDVAIGAVVLFFVIQLAGGIAQVTIPEELSKKPWIIFSLFLVSTAIATVAKAGVSKIALGFAFVEKATMRDFVATPRQYVRCFVAHIIYWLCTVIGLFLFILPGIVFAVTFQFYEFFILKYDSGIFESFRKSESLTSGQRLPLFAFDILALLLALAGLLACYIGAYVTVPISIAALAYVFRTLIRERKWQETVTPTPEEITEPPQPESAPIEKPKAYPTVSQAVLLTLTYITLAIFLFAPLGVVEHISGYALTDIVPLEILVQVVTLSLIIWFVIRKGRVALKDIVVLRSFNIWLLFPIALTLSGLGILGSEMDNLLNYLIKEPAFFREIMEELFSDPLEYLAIAVLLAPVAEEIFYRGIIVRGFSLNYTTRKTIYASAILFALVHINPWQIPSAFIGGLILAWIFLETGSLWPCIYAHAFYNGLNLIVSEIVRVEIPGFTLPAAADVVSFQPWWFNLIGIILALIGLLWMNRLFVSNRAAGPDETYSRLD
jgi:membrane protease YdiL (CAAX protease family)